LIQTQRYSFLQEQFKTNTVRITHDSKEIIEDMSLMNRASSLAHYELLGDANLMNTELEKYRSITADDLLRESQKIFRKENSNTLYYHIRPTQHAE
jgi:hypothetical protein